MQRWQLTTGLASAAVLAAILVPDLLGGNKGPTPLGPTVDPLIPSTPLPVPPPAAHTGLLGLSAQLDQGALLQGAGEDRYLVIEVSAPELQGDVRRPVHLSVVMDVSGSMAGRGKITSARTAAAALVDQLSPSDTFSLVTFSNKASVRLAQQGVTDSAAAHRLISGIEPAGGTNLYDGLLAGMEQLKSDSLQGVKRVVILSDGMANIGVTDEGSLTRAAGSLIQQGVTVSALGLGLDYNEDLLGAMSDSGGGRYRFVDQADQLASMFREELQQMTAVAGREVALTVEVPGGVHVQEIYGYDASLTGDGFRVFLGDIHGGETRKVVARVHVPDGNLGEVGVATVHLSYVDPDKGEQANQLAKVAATVTPDNRVARRSVNAPAAVSAVSARAGRLMDEGARAFDKGDLAGNQARYQETVELLNAAASDYKSPELAKVAEEAQQQMDEFEATPVGGEGASYQVKKSKEAARDYGRR